MSVPKYKREENKLQALVDTINMTKYTIQMCENERIFPKKCRWNICSRIMDNCLDSIVKIRQANKIRPTNKEQADQRTSLQYEVLQNFEALWTLMELAYNVYSISSEKMGNWSALMLEADEKVAAWRNHDIRDFKKKFSI